LTAVLAAAETSSKRERQSLSLWERESIQSSMISKTKTKNALNQLAFGGAARVLQPRAKNALDNTASFIDGYHLASLRDAGTVRRTIVSPQRLVTVTASPPILFWASR
jgi:hypothetical protein